MRIFAYCAILALSLTVSSSSAFASVNIFPPDVNGDCVSTRGFLGWDMDSSGQATKSYCRTGQNIFTDTLGACTDGQVVQYTVDANGNGKFACSDVPTCTDGLFLTVDKSHKLVCAQPEATNPILYSSSLDGSNGYSAAWHNTTSRTVFVSASMCAGGDDTRDLTLALSPNPIAIYNDTGVIDSISSGSGRRNDTMVVPPGWYTAAWMDGNVGCIGEFHVIQMYP